MLKTKNGKLYVNDSEVIKGWESISGWYWFATELEEEDYGPLIDSGKVWEIKEIDLPHAGRRD